PIRLWLGTTGSAPQYALTVHVLDGFLHLDKRSGTIYGRPAFLTSLLTGGTSDAQQWPCECPWQATWPVCPWPPASRGGPHTAPLRRPTRSHLDLGRFRRGRLR